MSLRPAAKARIPVDSSAKSPKQQEESAEMPRIRHRSIAKLLGRLLVIIVICVYIMVPLIARFAPSIHHKFIFFAFARWPPFQDVTNPVKLGMEATRNLYVETPNDITLGTWHVLPSSLIPESQIEQNQEFYDKSLSSGHKVMLYVHGNAGNRASRHRVALYQVLRELDYHVIAFDYRGYSDSTPIGPTEDGVVEDSKNMYKWLRGKVGNSSIFVWGHSLGTGVATKMVQQLIKEGTRPSGLFLEAPFNNLREEVRYHPFLRFHKYMPGFDWFFLDPLQDQNLLFESDKNIRDVTIPVIIFHATDDNVVPYELGRKLFIAGNEGRSPSIPPVEFITLDGNQSYGHLYIHKAPHFRKIIKEFVDKWS